MSELPNLTRRQILDAIPLLGAGGLLLPLRPARAAASDTHTPAVIRGAITDAATGKPTSAKLRLVHSTTGEVHMPAHSIKTMPDRRHYFYAKGSYEVTVPPGRYRIEAVRGLCHDVAVAFTEVGPGITHVVNLNIPVLKDLHTDGWYSGNTHTHYHLEIDEDLDERLRMVPPAEDLDVSVISYLIRNDSPYITNKYPIGRLPDFSRDGSLVDMGEECRNNHTFEGFGYGHCLFVNIPRLVNPVTTGLMSADDKSPDFPTLSMIAAEAQKIGGTTIWCHNGSGVELPVAAVMGFVNAYNAGDGLEADYARYYRLLDSGLRIPLSTGTDWWIYDHNRVFVKTGKPFTYDRWIAGLRAGRSFVSNGPLLDLTVNGQGPAAVINDARRCKVVAKVISRVPFERVEIIRNGEIVADQAAVGGKEVRLEREIEVDESGWIAARVTGGPKTYSGHSPFAHTSPIYLNVAGAPQRRASAAGAFIDELILSERMIGKTYRFASESQRAIAIGRFEEGRKAFARLVQS